MTYQRTCNIHGCRGTATRTVRLELTHTSATAAKLDICGRDACEDAARRALKAAIRIGGLT